MLAVRMGRVRDVDMLLALGADSAKTDDQYMTCAMIAGLHPHMLLHV